ncbi:MAG: ATP-binding cassette domain-containing protein [Rhizobiales bacterium]|nr:ATP-binding cassette domain-containing protein [Hyphomicrobiales bacterium]
MAKLTLKNLSKNYGQVNVLNNINLDIEDCEFLVLVGPSGCGKSTLLRMIAGLETISGGELFIDDKLMNNVEARQRDIAMVFQSYALYPHMSVAQNIGFPLRIRGKSVDEIDIAVKRIAKIIGLDDILHRKPKELSGGQRQRVAMGRAIIRNPKVFLFDEPLSNLDAKLRAKMRLQIRDLHKLVSATSVYVTHDQIEAMTLADKVVLLNEGKIQQAGTPLELYECPKNIFVAGFIGSPEMNFFNGHIEIDKNIITYSGYSTSISINLGRNDSAKHLFFNISLKCNNLNLPLSYACATRAHASPDARCPGDTANAAGRG